MEIISTNNNTLLLDDGSGNLSYSEIKKTTKDFRYDSRQKLLISSSNKGGSGVFNNTNVVKTCAAAAHRTSLTCPTTQQQEYCAIDNDYNNNWEPGRKTIGDIDSGRSSRKAAKFASNPVTAAFLTLGIEELQQNTQRKSIPESFRKSKLLTFLYNRAIIPALTSCYPAQLKFEEKTEIISTRPLNSQPKFKIVIKVPSLKNLSDDTLPSLSKMMLCTEYQHDQPSNIDCSFQTYRNIRSGVHNHLSNHLAIDNDRFSIINGQSTLNTLGNNCNLMLTCDSNSNFAPNSSANIVNTTAVKREFLDEERSSASSTQSALTCTSSPISSSPNGDFLTPPQTSNYNPPFVADYVSLAQAGLTDVHHHYPLGNFVSVCSNIISQDNIYATSDNFYQSGIDEILVEERDSILPNSGCANQQTSSNNESNRFFRPVYDRLKLERKRERNRAAATKCRRRKLERIAFLQNQVDEINQQNELLRSKLLLFADDVCRLRRIFENHRANGCMMGLNFDEGISCMMLIGTFKRNLNEKSLACVLTSEISISTTLVSLASCLKGTMIDTTE
uniref:BZIP domain-containing protein n=1 Tax=Romanomermis culicivorax TaxID=13658 RepID=A0A915IAN1_ROMCU